MDVDFFEDEKVMFISAKFGVKGDGILVRLFCKIYRQGYGLKFDDDFALLLARSVGDTSLHGLVRDVVFESIKRGLFHKGIFDQFGILTSAGIQKRYTKICTDSKRKNWQIPENMDLLAGKLAFTPEEMPENTGEKTQRKVKESKVKKRTGGDESPDAPSIPDEKFEKFQIWVAKHAGNVAKMKEPFTQEQFNQLSFKFSPAAVRDLILKMNNWKPLLQKNISAYQTFLNWSRKEHNQQNSEPRKTASDLQEESDKRILQA